MSVELEIERSSVHGYLDFAIAVLVAAEATNLQRRPACTPHPDEARADRARRAHRTRWEYKMAGGGNHAAAAPEVRCGCSTRTHLEAGISYSEAVEIALCFGWIDSLTRKYDTVSRIQQPLRASRGACGRSSMSNGRNVS